MGKILHASGSGYFPSCIEEVPSIESNFKSTLKNMMSVYWRVSQWKAKISGSATDVFDEVFTFSDTDYNLNRTFGPSTEEELILCNPRPLLFSTEVVIIASSSGTDFNGSINFNLDPRERVKKENGLYSIASNLQAGFPGSDFSVDSNYDFEIGSCRINMAGGSIVTPLFTDGDIYKSGNVVLIFTARGYYSYGGTYNTQTGAPL